MLYTIALKYLRKAAGSRRPEKAFGIVAAPASRDSCHSTAWHEKDRGRFHISIDSVGADVNITAESGVALASARKSESAGESGNSDAVSFASVDGHPARSGILNLLCRAVWVGRWRRA